MKLLLVLMLLLSGCASVPGITAQGCAVYKPTIDGVVLDWEYWDCEK